MKERKTELSVLNVFFCLLVIFIHVSSNPVTYLTKGSLELAAVYAPWKLASFVVYGFLFLGGIRFSLHPPGKGLSGTGKYYLKRLVRIVIPFVIWVLVYCIWNHLTRGGENFFADFLSSLYTGRAASHFYYIIVAIQLYILAPVWKRLKKESASVVLPVLLALTILFSNHLPGILSRLGFTGEVLNDRIFTSYMFYWAAGIYAGLWYEEFRLFVERHKAGITVFYILAAVPEVYFTYRGYAYADWYSFTGELHIIYIIAAILFFFMIASGIKKAGIFSSSLFTLLDRCTFSVYLSHLLVMGAWDLFQSEFLPSLDIMGAYPLRALATYGITISLCMGAAYVFGKISGKNKVKKS